MKPIKYDFNSNTMTVETMGGNMIEIKNVLTKAQRKKLTRTAKRKVGEPPYPVKGMKGCVII